MKILFQGDSITDAERDYSDPHDLGKGYPLYAAAEIRKMFPNREFEFIDLGISGNTTEELKERWTDDAVNVQPDVISILIGINDTWHHAGDRNWLPNDIFESNYRGLLERIKNETSAKIIILEQFLLPVADKLYFRDDVNPKIQITRKLAREYADAFIPLDGLFAAKCIGRVPETLADDGVHPTAEAAKFIGKLYARTLASII